MLVTVKWTEDPEHPLPAPPPPVGGQWQYVLVHDGDMVSFAERAGELVAVMIPGYETLGDSDRANDQALLLRYNHLVALAEYYQGQDVDRAQRLGLLAGAGEEVLTALYSERTVPFEGERWDLPIALILLATDYQPYTERVLPKGERVLLLDPATEINYLVSLHDLRFVAFWRAVPAGLAPTRAA
jgi:hypothetical protein